jgi:hypothetical protein
MGVLSSSVKPWHCAAAELIGRLIINPDNEPFLLPVIPQVNVFLEFGPLFGFSSSIYCCAVMQMDSNKAICFSALQVSYLHWFT